MSFIIHPRRTFRDWRERQRQKCVVTIDNPPMKIKGKPHTNIMEDANFPTFMAFFGVPYATPPTDHLRLQPPKPLEARSRGIRFIKAYKTNLAALQYDFNAHEPYGHEDCLYLNIYMAKKPEEMPQNMPVLVFFHGGGFEHGTGNIYDIRPDAIVKQNLIFVTVNYRLGIYGFLNTGTEKCRGNAGLKDQVQALKWIKANIDRFGGDPYNVTIIGHSAGATCVNLHMISPLSKGLFQRAIVCAGGLYCPWGYLGKQKLAGRLLAKEYGLEHELRNVLVETLLDEDAYDLLETMQKITNDVVRMQSKTLTIVCGPSLEKIEKDAFIPKAVEELMKVAKPVPLIAGLTEREGYMFTLVKYDRYKDTFDILVRNDDQFVDFLMANFRWSKETALKNKDKLRNKYFPDLKRMTTQEIQDQLATFITDIWYRRFYDNFKIGGTSVPFYVYNFKYLASDDQIRQTDSGDTIRFTAPSHGEELTYLFQPHFLKDWRGGQIPPEMSHITEHLCSLWGSFCKNGIPLSQIEPDVVWELHTEEQPRYLEIDESSRMIQSRLHQERWRELNEIVEAELQVASPSSLNIPDSPFDYLNLRKLRPERKLLSEIFR